jgi:hypothetical protein
MMSCEHVDVDAKVAPHGVLDTTRGRTKSLKIENVLNLIIFFIIDVRR